LKACEEKGEHLNIIVGQSARVKCRTDYTSKQALFQFNRGCSQINQARHHGNKQIKDNYPEISDISTEIALRYLLQSLKLFLLQTIICDKTSERKVRSTGQAIMQATRPYPVLAPLQLGLGVCITCSSPKCLLIPCTGMWFSCSYNEDI
jgi:hypothetical protein